MRYITNTTNKPMKLHYACLNIKIVKGVRTLFCSADKNFLQTNSWGPLCCGFTAALKFGSLWVSLYRRANVSHFLRRDQHQGNHSILPLPPSAFAHPPHKTHLQADALFHYMWEEWPPSLRLLFPSITLASGLVQTSYRSIKAHTCAPTYDVTAAEACSRAHCSFASVSCQ